MSALRAQAARTDRVAGGNCLERLELLCDPGSLEAIRSSVVSRRLRAGQAPGDGVVAAIGRVDDRPIACYAQDVSYLGGSLGEAHADTIDRLLQFATRAKIPVIGFIESGGARIQEGTAALCGYGRIFRHNALLSGVVPQLSIISGMAAGGGCYSPALTDFVAMTEDSTMFLTGPSVIGEVTGERIGITELGGPRVHERNGVCDFVVDDEVAAAQLCRDLLSYLPQCAGGELPRAAAVASSHPDPSTAVPRSFRQVYDVRAVCEGILDRGSLLEVAPRWARSLLTGFARIEGRPVGLIASQPRYLGGILDAESAQKGARFVETCDAFGVPLLVLVDTPGFMPGLEQESAGVIRFGATLVRAFAKATTPRITLVLRKAYGGAFIAMNSRDLGADLVFAWPGAEIGVMSAESAMTIVRRRELSAASDPVALRRALAGAYAREHLGAEVAAREGFVDEVIPPAQTRDRLARALETLQGVPAAMAPGRR